MQVMVHAQRHFWDTLRQPCMWADMMWLHERPGGPGLECTAALSKQLSRHGIPSV